MTSWGIKPVRNLQVSCRDKIYVIDGVTTVEELVKRLQHESRISSKDIKSGKVLFQGKVLDKKGNLRNAGVQDGSNLIVVTNNYQMKGSEALAVFLEILSNEDNWEMYKKKFKERKESPSVFFKEFWRDAQYLKRQDVSNAIRNSMDLSYHRLRAIWDFPFFRSALSDPIRIEMCRKVIQKHLSKKILAELGAKKLVESPEEWKKKVLKFTAALIRVGDAVLDGVLDVLLDILKGAGKTQNHQYDNPLGPTYNPGTTLDNPSLASDLLFELSDSEDEN